MEQEQIHTAHVVPALAASSSTSRCIIPLAKSTIVCCVQYCLNSGFSCGSVSRQSDKATSHGFRSSTLVEAVSGAYMACSRMRTVDSTRGMSLDIPNSVQIPCAGGKRASKHHHSPWQLDQVATLTMGSSACHDCAVSTALVTSWVSATTGLQAGAVHRISSMTSNQTADNTFSRS